ncbi:uncharacterized protein BX663DRAFT_529590 [Cokeromyces recurvatus]|uniref:uncharacterized protein n=1 Tax=Cokeromyces recurvatus TaxID=90255 RepID=UPI0022202B71|nr:uncharacterized protein BX663DRAFT_529590 [Cokeromyces recurvatus]KAI7906173.1 hypothetical protein BX663DRAFT_529590 [Cokeromyces recurvatus]
MFSIAKNNNHFYRPNTKHFHRNNNNKNKKQKFANKKQPGNKIEKNNIQPINTKVKAPLFDKSKLTASWKLSRRFGPGLINSHNTCFLNSLLQCITYTPPLAQYLLQGEHRKTCQVKGFCALCAMEIHTRRCLTEPKSFSKGAAILPNYFTANLRGLSKSLRLGRQEDVHELYMFLLDAFQKSVVYGLGKLPPQVEETSLIYQIFGGKLRSQLKCYNCKATSNNFETCLDLSLECPPRGDSRLLKALELYTKVDVIGDDPNNRYNCDKCKQKVKAGKQMTISELPMMLAIHLKLFAFDFERGYMTKLGSRVKFPEVLDMAPYVSKDKGIQRATYRLYGVISHLGYGCNSGHYRAHARAPNGQWNYLDDEIVRECDLEQVLSQAPYMLFYQQEKIVPPSVTDTTHQNDTTTTTTIAAANVINEQISIKKSLIAAESTKEEKKRKRVQFVEDQVISDNPRAWYVRSSEQPRRSLRGNLSPPTFGAHISHDMTWEILDANEFYDRRKKAKKQQ